ncbi:MAG: hypothetical protein EPO46_01455 [Lysobacter sp.]|nr:MAG: hypothetical protein EPO46_01455 [Lysobacter sp.]
MKTSIRTGVGVALLGLASVAIAQSAGGSQCPRLPASSGLTWEYKAAGDTEFCRALRADGSEAFGLYVAAKSAFKPGRANRAEEASIDGRPTFWYRSEIGSRPDLEARETLVPLGNGRVAYLWIQARSKDELGQSIANANDLRFGANGAQLSSK